MNAESNKVPTAGTVRPITALYRTTATALAVLIAACTVATFALAESITCSPLASRYDVLVNNPSLITLVNTFATSSFGTRAWYARARDGACAHRRELVCAL